MRFRAIDLYHTLQQSNFVGRSNKKNFKHVLKLRSQVCTCLEILSISKEYFCHSQIDVDANFGTPYFLDR